MPICPCPQSSIQYLPLTAYQILKSLKIYYLFFQAQNHRELSFKKGDLVYIRRQVDDNWYEGKKNFNFHIKYVF